jgi:chromate transporter
MNTEGSTATPSLAEALRFWLKLGFISFGGPAGQIAIMHQELVERRRWLSEQRFLHALNYCMLLPGPEAQQLATYIGWLLHRSWGGIAAGLLFLLPSLLMLIALAWIYVAFGDAPALAGLFYGIKPVVAAIVLHAAWRIGRRVLHSRLLAALAVAAFLAILLFDVPFPAIIAAAALTGLLAGRWLPAAFGRQAPADGQDESKTADSGPRPPHTHFRWRTLRRIALVGALLWLVPMAALLALYGWNDTLTQMGWFFTKAALLTFGGAYTVLPYVYQTAVERHAWLTPSEMMDGLALGETTPGPLIMIVAFVAFLGAHGSGGDAAVALGIAAALIAAWFTFLPSFLFILAGGPLVESTQGSLRFAAPLAGITAAVVGVIAHLGLFFAGQVFWPAGFAGAFDPYAALIAGLALLALFVFRRGLIEVIAAGAMLGLLSTLPI